MRYLFSVKICFANDSFFSVINDCWKQFLLLSGMLTWRNVPPLQCVDNALAKRVRPPPLLPPSKRHGHLPGAPAKAWAPGGWRTPHGASACDLQRSTQQLRGITLRLALAPRGLHLTTWASCTLRALVSPNPCAGAAREAHHLIGPTVPWD